MSYLKELGKPDDVVNEKDFVVKNKKLSPFDYISSICYDKTDIMQDEKDESQYSAFIVNRGLCFFCFFVLPQLLRSVALPHSLSLVYRNWFYVDV